MILITVIVTIFAYCLIAVALAGIDETLHMLAFWILAGLLVSGGLLVVLGIMKLGVVLLAMLPEGMSHG